MASGNDTELIERIMDAKSLSDLEEFSPQVGLAKRVFEMKKSELEAVAKAAEEEARRREAVAKAAEEEARRRGTYFASADDLWSFSRERLMPSRYKDLFSCIAREKRPECYKNVYQPPTGNRSTNGLPDFQARSVGTNSAIVLQGTDILGNSFHMERAHNAPDSPTCLPSWGHAGEGALGKVTGKSKVRTSKRLLLVMGTRDAEGKDGYRYSPFNFIRFSRHDEYYDKAPHIIFLPIMTVDQIKEWNGTPYSVLVITCDFDGRSASDVWKGVFQAETAEEASPEEIDMATKSLQAFMKGLAASLMQGYPIQLAKAAGTGKHRELRQVQKCVRRQGLSLPIYHRSKDTKPVCKLHFRHETNGTVADPWMLLAKASVNLSWKCGQNLLPACEPRETANEGDHVFWQNMAEFEMARGCWAPPADVEFTTPRTPQPNTGVREGVPFVTPEKEGENWEYLDGE